jgi:hypothetical protein
VGAAPAAPKPTVGPGAARAVPRRRARSGVVRVVPRGRARSRAVRVVPRGSVRPGGGAPLAVERLAGRRADPAVSRWRAGPFGVPGRWTRTGHRAVVRRAVRRRAEGRGAPRAVSGLLRGERLREAGEAGEWSERPGDPTRSRAARQAGRDGRPGPNEWQVAGHQAVPRRRIGSGARRRARPRRAEQDGRRATSRGELDGRRATLHRPGPDGRRRTRPRLEPAGPRRARRAVGRELRRPRTPRVEGPGLRGLPVREGRPFGSTRR